MEVIKTFLQITPTQAEFIYQLVLKDKTPLFKSTEDLYNLIGALYKMKVETPSLTFEQIVKILKGPADEDLTSKVLQNRESFEALYRSLPVFDKERKAEDAKIGQFNINATATSKDKRVCPNCKAVGTITSDAIQRRAADEGATVFDFCRNCAALV